MKWSDVSDKDVAQARNAVLNAKVRARAHARGVGSDAFVNRPLPLLVVHHQDVDAVHAHAANGPERAYIADVCERVAQVADWPRMWGHRFQRAVRDYGITPTPNLTAWAGPFEPPDWPAANLPPDFFDKMLKPGDIVLTLGEKAEGMVRRDNHGWGLRFDYAPSDTPSEVIDFVEEQIDQDNQKD